MKEKKWKENKAGKAGKLVVLPEFVDALDLESIEFDQISYSKKIRDGGGDGDPHVQPRYGHPDLWGRWAHRWEGVVSRFWKLFLKKLN